MSRHRPDELGTRKKRVDISRQMWRLFFFSSCWQMKPHREGQMKAFPTPEKERARQRATSHTRLDDGRFFFFFLWGAFAFECDYPFCRFSLFLDIKNFASCTLDGLILKNQTGDTEQQQQQQPGTSLVCLRRGALYARADYGSGFFFLNIYFEL